MEKYIILRRVQDPVEMKTRGAGDPEPRGQLSKHIEELSDEERTDLLASDDVSAVPVRMPVRLIAPMRSGIPQPLNTSDLPPQWGMDAIGGSGKYTGRGVTVAVLDTGIDKTHPAFAGVPLVTKDFTAPDAPETVVDDNGHGTHCAGTIFGRPVNGRRIGVAPNVEKALVGKVLGKGGGSIDSIIKGIEWAIEQRAHVISMSLGIDYPAHAAYLQHVRRFPVEVATSRALADYYQTVRLFETLHEHLRNKARVFNHSVLLIAAAGNESLRQRKADWTIDAGPPAKAQGFIAVGALGRGDAEGSVRVASFSNSGPMLAGPGEDIVSAWPGNRLCSLSGTSMATPHVAGIAALWGEMCIRERQFFDAEWVRSKLLAKCEPHSLRVADVGNGLALAP